jgi:hypothetical protein
VGIACPCSGPSSVDIQSRFLNDIAGMANKINCSTHGGTEEAFVCSHLLGDSVGRGFNRKDPDAEHPFPDAWCDDCELIRAAHNGWNEESEKLLKISLLACLRATSVLYRSSAYLIFFLWIARSYKKNRGCPLPSLSAPAQSLFEKSIPRSMLHFLAQIPSTLWETPHAESSYCLSG